MSQKMKIYTDQEIEEKLSGDYKKWTYVDGVIRREFEFGDFTEAFSFMTAVALEAEKMGHHPDWSNVYNKVRVALNTHSASGITQLDFDLAARIDRIFTK
jgi:4a-hydroxytetrahydrobiopterin dehydratase